MLHITFSDILKTYDMKLKTTVQSITTDTFYKCLIKPLMRNYPLYCGAEKL